MKFKYTAKTLRGQNVRGQVEASSERAAVELVREQKLIPVKIKQIGEGNSMFSFGKALGHVSGGDIANFTRQLSTMMTAGLPLTDALNLLKIQSSSMLAPTVTTILADVQSGMALSSAMSKHPKVFSRVYVALIKAGESAGVMEKILTRLAETSEKSREFKAKVIGAMIYPIIILVGMLGVMIIMMLVVVPKLSAIYGDFGAELPIMTKILITSSNISVKYWWAILGVFVGFALLVRKILSTESGQSQWNSMMYKMPVVGNLSRQVTMTELTRTLALLLTAGISVVEAINIVSESISNINIRKELLKIGKQVEKGFPVSISFTESGLFPPLMGQMMAVGEETGKMDDVLSRLSLYFESESNEKIKGLTTAIEPIILIVLAVGVGFLLYAIIMPIYAITDKI